MSYHIHLKEITLFIFAQLLFSASYSQVNIDSLRHLVNHTNNDSIRIDLYYKISKEISHTQPDSGIYYAWKAYQFAKKTNNSRGLASAYSQVAFSYYKMENLDSAFVYWNKSAEIYEAINDSIRSANIWENMGIQYIFRGQYETSKDLLDKARAYYIALDTIFQQQILLNYGLLYDIKGDYDLAYDYYHQAFIFADSIGDKYRMGLAYNNICIMYYYMGNCQKSLEYGHKTLNLWVEDKYRFETADVLKNMAICYERLGYLDSSIFYNERALQLEIEIGNEWGQAQVFHNLGSLYTESGELSKGLEYLHRAESIKSNFDAREGLATTYNQLAHAYTLNEQYGLARNFLDKGYDLARDLNIPEEIKQNRFIGVKLFEQTGEYKKALDAQLAYTAIKDSLLNIETATKIEEINQRYESAKKEVEIRNLEIEKEQIQHRLVRRTLLLGFATIGVILLFISVYFYRKYLKEEKEKNIFLDEQYEYVLQENQSLKTAPLLWPALKEKFVTIPGKKKMKIKIGDILYIRSDGNGVYFHTVKKKHHAWVRIKNISGLLDENHFVQTHRSFIVNVHEIAEIKSNQVELKNGEQVSLSRSFVDDLTNKSKNNLSFT